MTAPLPSSPVTETLLPCPFCGCTDLAVANTGAAWVKCQSCEAEGPPECTDEDATRLWNRRFDFAQRPAHRIDDHMTRARLLVENHIEAFGMVPHPDLIKDAIADMSQQSFDLGFRAAGGSVSDTSTHQSAPVELAPQNTAERMPSSDAASAGADTCSDSSPIQGGK